MTKLLVLSNDLDKYRQKLVILLDSNYLDFDLNIQALEANDGNLNAAISWILEHEN